MIKFFCLITAWFMWLVLFLFAVCPKPFDFGNPEDVIGAILVATVMALAGVTVEE